MINLIASTLLVFLIAVLTFTLVFIVAIRMGLLPVQQEIANGVDNLFFWKKRNPIDDNHQIMVIEIGEKIWTAYINSKGLSKVAMNTAVAASTILNISPRLVGQGPSVLGVQMPSVEICIGQVESEPLVRQQMAIASETWAIA